jgi:ribose transport system permease protein
MTALVDTQSTIARSRPPWRRWLSFRNISIIYVWVLLVVIFSVAEPATFPTTQTVKLLLSDQALTALLAVGVVIPLAAGAFDLSIGSQLGLGAIVVAWALASGGFPVWLAILFTLAVGAVVGLVNGLLIVKAGISSFITTLGLSSVLLAAISWISNDEQILNLGQNFQKLATTVVLGVPLSVIVVLVLAVVVWYFLDFTQLGRSLYATGGNAEAARLAGVPTGSVIIGSLIACGVLAALAGVLLSSTLATGDPTVGPAYLLPAFAAAFLGSTQFRGGRFNVAGTVVAVYVLGTGVKGLQLMGAPAWIPSLFNGAALLLAVGLARRQGVSFGRTRRKAPKNPAPDTDS